MLAVKNWMMALTVLVAAAAYGQETIRDIEFRGLRGLSDETLRFYLDLEVGKPLDETALDKHIRELWDRRLIDDIKVEKEPVEGGIKLTIDIVERPVLRSIDYENLKGMSRSDVNERLAKEQVGVREGDPLDLGELARLEHVIEQMYQEKGYRFAEATYRLEVVSSTERKAIIRIDQAEKVRIGRIRFLGNEVIGDWRLRWTMKKTKQTGFINRMFRKDIYNPASIEEDLQKVRDLYRSVGYKTAVVGEPKLSVIPRGSKRRLGVEIPVEEGKRWRLGKIRVEGNHLFEEKILLAKFKRPRGGWLRAKAINDGLDAVRDLYRNYGHIMSEIRGDLEERESNVADLVVRVTEGDQYRVGRLEFEGNNRTRDKVLRREFRVQEGTLLNMGAVKNSLFKINQLQYFKLDESDPISFEDFDSEKKTVDLLVHGQESDRTELQVGGGWSESYGFFGQLSVRTLNFLGRGESAGVSFQKGAYSDQYDLSYAVPWFLDKPQSIGAQIYNSNVDYSQALGQSGSLNQTNSQKAKGGTLTYGRSFGFFQTFSVSYSLFDREDRLSTYDINGKIVPLTYDVRNSSIRPVYAFQSIDSRVEPTIGQRFTASMEYAGGVLGGNNEFIRPELNFSWFHPLSYVPVKTVLGFNLEGGLVKPVGGADLVPLERYFLGGENSIRGFRFRDLTARCLGGEPYPGRPNQPCRPDERMIDSNFSLVGGEKYLQFNLEYHLLLGGPFRLIGFMDAAQVYGPGQKVDVNRLRFTAGAEVRIFVPVFGAPLRFIYSKNLDPLVDDDFESFQFSIGTTF